jgi:DNA polymerase-3 subunit delta
MAKSTDTVPVFQKILSEIHSGHFSPVYTFHGEETYFIDALCAELESRVVSPESKSFNQTIVYGKEVSANDIIGMSRRYPMMSDYQLVMVKDAHDLKELEPLIAYLEKPLPSTILVLAFRKGKLDMRSKFAKLASKYTEGNFPKLRDYQIKDWLPVFAKSKGKILDTESILRILDLIGADLSVIQNELEKIFVMVKDEFIKVQHIDEHVGFNREYNVFELQNALGSRNFNKSIQIAHQMGVRMKAGELIPITSLLYSYFTKILALHSIPTTSKQQIAQSLGVNVFFVDDYLRAKSNYSLSQLDWVINQLKLLDLRSKGIHRGSATDADLLLETVVNILNGSKK